MQSSMWRSVIKELDDQDLIGESLHVLCNRHPETVELVSKPGELPLIAPDGTFSISDRFSAIEHYLKVDACVRAMLG